ncbi:Heat shock protein ssb1 [Hypoxylon texense]
MSTSVQDDRIQPQGEALEEAQTGTGADTGAGSGIGTGTGINNGDYDLERPIDTRLGMRRGLTSYGDAHFSLFLRKAFIKALGYSDDALARPVVGVADARSGFNPCHANAPQLAEAVARGVMLAGGIALAFPTISLHESFAAPTSMFLRNLMSMDTEEMVRAQPVDAVVLVGGCDKTTPAQLMGGISANKPILHLVTGPMMPGSHRGVRIGACTDCRNNWASYRAGVIDIEEIAALNDELAPTAGTCGVMGTASTMACILVALGLMPFKGATAPAVSSARLRIAEETGANAVKIIAAGEKLKPQSLLTRESFLNAITVLQAIGGSTNAVVHLLAIANRHPTVAGTITLDTFDEVGRRTPLLVDLKPSGANYMTDFHNSGGMAALLRELRPLLHLDALTVTGRTLGEALDAERSLPVPRELSCIQPFATPLYPASSLVVLRGNLAPHGAVMKASASKDRRLLKHSGRAVVFAGSADLARRVDAEDLEADADSVLVLQNIGPVGNPGMPEAGLVPIPRKLAARGVADMLRVSDGRMSGTAGGTIVLHVAPEAADPGSVLGVVRDGDVITCDVEARVLRVEISDEEIRRRQEARRAEVEGEGSEHPWKAREKMRGYRGLYMRSVNQADQGADFDFLRAEGI